MTRTLQMSTSYSMMNTTPSISAEPASPPSTRAQSVRQLPCLVLNTCPGSRVRCVGWIWSARLASQRLVLKSEEKLDNFLSKIIVNIYFTYYIIIVSKSSDFCFYCDVFMIILVNFLCDMKFVFYLFLLLLINIYCITLPVNCLNFRIRMSGWLSSASNWSSKLDNIKSQVDVI